MSDVALARANGTQTQADVPSTRLATSPTAALGAIVTYFPTEVNVLYTAIIAAITNSDTTSRAGQWVAWWGLLAAAPIVVWLVYAARLRGEGKNLPADPRTWPAMEMIFSQIAFAVWGAALPDSPFEDFDWYSPALAGVAVLAVTAALGLVAPVFGRRPTLPGVRGQ